MNKFRFTIKLLVTATFLLAFASIAQAQATRTWVSGVGDDVNPCSRTAPCKTYAGAISKTATGGEISTLDPGGFGALTVTKSITVDGTTGQGYGSILASGFNGVIVNDTTNVAVVNLRNLSIQGIGPSATNPGFNGVRFIGGKSLTVENCVINGFTVPVAQGGHGIEVNMNATATATEVYIRNTTIQNCRVGVRLNQPNGFVSANFDGVRIGHLVASGGGIVGDGIRFETNAFGEIRDANIAFALGGSAAGIALTGTGTVSIINTTVSHCSIGINITGNSTNRITHSQIVSNPIGVQFAGVGSILRSFGDNVYDGNTNNFVGGAISPQTQQ